MTVQAFINELSKYPKDKVVYSINHIGENFRGEIARLTHEDGIGIQELRLVDFEHFDTD